VNTWPAERFYWSVLDGAVKAGPVPPGLLAALEGDLPEPLEHLHAVCAPIGEGRVIVCAARRAELAQVRSPRLTPDRLPPCAEGDASALNLLVGEFEPRVFRRARARQRLIAMAAVIVCALLVMLGLWRRARVWDVEAADARRAQAALLRGVGALSTEALAQDLARTRRDSAGRVMPPPDASLTLASVLSSWPRVPSKPSSLSIAEKTASLAVSVEGDASPFLSAFKAPPGWTLQEPQVSAMGALTRLTLLLKKEERP
jgi:hypothetical protein